MERNTLQPIRSEQTYGSDQLLTFMMNNGEYGIDILRVQEIRAWSDPMPIPNAPPFIKGMINIRGDVVPIADLRERLGFEQLPYGPTTVVIVVRIESEESSRVMGITVDAMSDVYNIPRDAIKPSPELGAGNDAALTKGIAMFDEKMVTILDVDQLFGSQKPKSRANEAA